MYSSYSETGKAGKGRSANFELLRIVAMFMVMVLHVNMSGGFCDGRLMADGGALTVAWGYEYLCIVAVNLYVLISGYFLVDTGFRTAKALSVYVTTLFWSLLLGFAGFLLSGGVDVLKESFIPLLTRRFWFVTDYLAMYALSPLLNIVVNRLTRRKHLIVLLLALPFVSVFALRYDSLQLVQGYSLGWFVYLYMVGSFLKRHPFEVKTAWLIGVCALFLVLEMTFNVLKGVSFVFALLGTLNYNSPFILACSLAIFMLFRKWRLKGGKWIGYLAPMTFGVYLSHHFIFFDDVAEWFASLRSSGTLFMLWFIPVAALCLFLVCAVAEYVRQCIFRVLKVGRAVETVAGWIDRKLNVDGRQLE